MSEIAELKKRIEELEELVELRKRVKELEDKLVPTYIPSPWIPYYPLFPVITSPDPIMTWIIKIGTMK